MFFKSCSSKEETVFGLLGDWRWKVESVLTRGQKKKEKCLLTGETIISIQSWRASGEGIFDVKDAPRTGRPVVENVDKITEIIEVDRLVSSRSIAQGLKIDLKTVLSHLRKVDFKKKFHVCGCSTN
ncbi:hypothetical protein TNCV_746711 [Trichonephila clavipes]|nr:hypothetical protein TNCV_746711 [Trichonephila clavipes]